MEKTDEELMQECSGGSREALEALFIRYQRRIFNFALRILNHRADAEDITAEIFLMLSSGKQAFRPQAKFSTWLYTVARNAAISKIRKRKNQVSSEDVSEFEMTDPSAAPDESVMQQDLAQHVRKAIQKLPLMQKEAIVLREYQGLSYGEISEVLAVSLENVKVLIFRAREVLRKELVPVIEEGMS